MLYTGSQAGVQPLGTQNSSHCSALQPHTASGPLTPPSASKYRNPYSSASLFAYAERASLVVEGPSPSPPRPPENRIYYKKRRPRHIPIIIRDDVANIALKEPSLSPEPQEPQELGFSQIPLGTLETLKLASLKYSLNQLPRTCSKPRHIPIVIPEYAHPFDPFPSTPPDSGQSSSPPSSTSPIFQIPEPVSIKKKQDQDLQTYEPIFVKKGEGDLRTHEPVGIKNREGDLRTYEPVGNKKTEKNLPLNPQVNMSLTNADSQTYQEERNNSQTSLSNGQDVTTADASSGSTIQPTSNVTAYMQQAQPGTTSLSGLVCNVHKCTGTPPHALVGATTTVLGDRLFVFGGRRLSRRRPQLTADLYELDLIRRHWTKVEPTGSIPPPRYFHSVCALGDNKLVCYGGMSPAASQANQAQATQQQQQQQTEQQPEVVVMSDVHIYDINTRVWTHIPIPDNPQGRYAHCATVLPSSAVFSSSNAPLSAIHNNPSSGNPNQGSIGVALDGTGGAEMVVVGGQDSGNTYIDQISVFNLRSLKWTATSSFSRSCGAYRSVVAPVVNIAPAAIGAGLSKEESLKPKNDPSSMLIYSNYNFLDVKLDLQIRLPDGTLVEKPMSGQFSPPGLRFPNGGVLNDHFVVSGTYLTSSRQEYALWALDLRTLTWSRIDSGGSIFSQGSWNRGVLWPRRNTFVILGDRKRALVDDYNHRRLNFTNICLVELEAFGLYDNPRHSAPNSSFVSSSAPTLPPNLRPKMGAWAGGGRPHFAAAEELGKLVLNIKEISDMDILTISGERIPVNSHILARRWGPYFVHLLREGSSAPVNGADATDNATLKATTTSAASRNSSITITPTVSTNYSSTTLNSNSTNSDGTTFHPPNSANLPAHSRSRALYLPHTSLTIQALLHFLYTSSLPPINHSLSTPQILCSLLQLARPYRVDGLLEAVVERLHQVMDGRNAAAVFNASAMAAGGGRGTGFDHFGDVKLIEEMLNGDVDHLNNGAISNRNGAGSFRIPVRSRTRDTVNGGATDDSEDDASSDVDGAGSVASAGDTGDGDGAGVGGSRTRPPDDEEEMWNAERSCVIGLQKRGLRGLMEGRRIRERGRSATQNGPVGQGPSAAADAGVGAGMGATTGAGGAVEVSG